MIPGDDQSGISAPTSDEQARRRVALARLAHELKTPLGAIVVLAEIMRDERLGPLGSPKYRAYAADIHQSAAHANAVIHAFLDPDSAEQEAGGPLEFVELDLARSVEAAVSALSPLADRSGIHLAARIPEGLPHVIADRRSLVQILNNLIANALKFTPPGGMVAVELSYRAGGPVVLSVSDSGDGMSEAELRRVTTEGAQTEALRRRSGGSGIGLPLVRTLAEAGGASFGIESKLGLGTTARVSFPHDRVVPV